MAKPKSTRTTTDKFPVGDDEAQVANVSGAPSPNTLPVARRAGGPTTPDLGGENKSNRRPIQINADTGQAFGEATRARARQVWANAVDRAVCPGCFPGQHDHLSNLLGLDGDRP